jgi:hypothetical protein
LVTLHKEHTRVSKLQSSHHGSCGGSVLLPTDGPTITQCW